jgi:hypothetical protein
MNKTTFLIIRTKRIFLERVYALFLKQKLYGEKEKSKGFG